MYTKFGSLVALLRFFPTKKNTLLEQQQPLWPLLRLPHKESEAIKITRIFRPISQWPQSNKICKKRSSKQRLELVMHIYAYLATKICKEKCLIIDKQVTWHRKLFTFCRKTSVCKKYVQKLSCATFCFMISFDYLNGKLQPSFHILWNCNMHK